MYLVEGADRSEAQRGFGRATEELEDRDSRGELLRCRLLHVDNGVGRFVDHHLTLVTQTTLYEVKHRTVHPVRREREVDTALSRDPCTRHLDG